MAFERGRRPHNGAVTVAEREKREGARVQKTLPCCIVRSVGFHLPGFRGRSFGVLSEISRFSGKVSGFSGKCPGFRGKKKTFFFKIKNVRKKTNRTQPKSPNFFFQNEIFAQNRPENTKNGESLLINQNSRKIIQIILK